MARPISTSIKVLLLTLSSIFLLIPGFSSANDPVPDDVVATIDGKPVYYREILADVKKAELYFWEAKGHKPTSSKDQEEIRKNIEKISKPILKNVIEIKIRDHWAEGQEINVTESEIDDYWEPIKVAIEKMPKEDFLNKIKPDQENTQALIDSAIAVYEKGKAKDDTFKIFNQKTVRNWSQASWELKIYELREKLQRDALMEDMNLTYEQALKRNRESRRNSVFYLKLNYKIYGILAKNDPEVRKWLEKNPLKLKHKTIDKRVQFKTPTRIMDKHERFWREMIRKSDIQILDPKYENVLTEIREDVLD